VIQKIFMMLDLNLAAAFAGQKLRLAAPALRTGLVSAWTQQHRGSILSELA
jgi:hypothetical protein